MSAQVEIPHSPSVVDDLEWHHLFVDRNGRVTWALGSLARDSYLAVPEEARQAVLYVINLLDGRHSVLEVESIVTKQGFKVDVESLVAKLTRANLLAEDSGGRGRRNEFVDLAVHLFSCSLRPVDRVLRALALLVWPIAILGTVIVGYSLISGILFRELLVQSYLQFAGSDFALWGILLGVALVSVVLHELGHAVVARACGLRPSRFTACLYLGISPMVYVSIPGLYAIPPRKRVAVWLAGPWVNLVLAAGCALSMSGQTGVFHSTLQSGLLVNLILVAVNLYPFLPLDGYFIASTVLRVTNIRAQALAFGRNRPGNISRGCRVLLCCYSVVMWGTMAFLVLREVWGIVSTVVFAHARGLNALETLDSLKAYMALLIVVIFAILLQRRRRTMVARRARPM